MRRFLAPTLTLAAAVVTLAACGSDTDDAATATSSSPVVSTVTVTAPASTVIETTEAEAAPAPETEQDTEAADAPPVASDACAAATQESLLAALRSSPDFNRRVANPTGFRRIQCSAPFALGSTAGTGQSSGVLFRRDGSAWTVLDIGSAIRCAQYGVTAANGLDGCVV